MKRRDCPQCDLRFKSKPRAIVEGFGKPVVTCPRCGHLFEIDDTED